MTAYTPTADEAQEIANALAGHTPACSGGTVGRRSCGPIFCVECSEALGDWVTWTSAHVTAALAPTIADMIAAHRVEALVMDDLAGDEAVLLGPA